MTTSFGTNPFLNESEIQTEIQSKLQKNNISYRKGRGNVKVAYLESGRAIQLANSVFGFNGWSCQVLDCREELVRLLYRIVLLLNVKEQSFLK